METNCILIHDSDNVATALRNMEAGEAVVAEGIAERIILLQTVALGHKVAVRDIRAGEVVYKYGSPIGTATAPITKGEHVHTQNVASDRGRGDLE